MVSFVGISLTYRLGSQIAGRRVGLAAETLLALSPLDIWYAQESRMVIFVLPAAVLIALGLAGRGWRA